MTGYVCGQTYHQPEGCFEHWKAKPRIPCKVCGKPTSSELDLCRKHASGYYVTQYINRLQNNARMAEIATIIVCGLGGYKRIYMFALE
ncbi:19106_t:CDS:2, partial [Rhizophagus irregularis]